jgi:oligoendopeptidase F
MNGGGAGISIHCRYNFDYWLNAHKGLNYNLSMSVTQSSTSNQIHSWSQVAPHFQDLAARSLDKSNVAGWLADWSRLSALLDETYNRLYVAVTCDTGDREAERRYQAFLDEVFPRAQAASQVLKEKLLSSGLEPEGFAIPLRNLRAEAALFREANLPLLSEEIKMASEYDKIAGAQTVEWQGQELTLPQLQPVYQDPDRARREAAWRLAAQRQLQDRQPINELWARFMVLRGRLAANTGYRTAGGQPDYRAYRWQQLLRFDYTPEDCLCFHRAIEAVVVPAAERLYEKRRQQLGVGSLRPWDLNVDPLGRPALRPFSSAGELVEKASAVFQQVDPQLGEYFEVMRRENLLDLESRKHKAPGGYCIDFPVMRKPFIFMNAAGLHEDVQTILHEGGHAFHVFETVPLPYHHQLQVGLEMAEVASMSMELLSAPYLAGGQGRFYSEPEAARARIEHLEQTILFWPYMAVVDAFQHWAYENPDDAMRPEACDAQWAGLWERFMPGVDWSGLEEEMKTGWQRKLHIHQVPFYYVEYGLAALGAMQVWRNARQDQPGAVAAYRRALALGGTQPLPKLFQAAGAKFAFDEATLSEAVGLAENTIETLEKI